jgi:dTMP kinase
VRRLYRFAPKPTVPFYFRVPLNVALDRILSGRPQLKFYEAGMDLGLSEDPYESFQMFQGRIYNEYEQMTTEFGLQVIDATLPIAEQQARVRRLVEPHLKGVLRVPVLPHADVLRREGLSGRYLATAKRYD